MHVIEDEVHLIFQELVGGGRNDDCKKFPTPKRPF